MTVPDLEPALSFCTHLVYGFAGNLHRSNLQFTIVILYINQLVVGINGGDNKLQSLDASLDLDQGKGHYRIITQLKRKYPGLKVLLSVGGGIDKDPEADTNKYLTMLESMGARQSFINSAYSMIKTYDFDGIDLAWQFPPNKPKKIRSSLGTC